MPRTDAQNLAFDRDKGYCQWCKYRPGVLVKATDVHHIAHRYQDTDIPELCISLCHTCHIFKHHGQGRNPSTSDLALVMRLFHKIDIFKYSPYLKANVGT